jgi:hypothetical protein
MPVHVPSTAEALAELGFSSNNEAAPAEIEIRKAYLLQCRLRHPDKGGTKEDFQKLVNAYEFLSGMKPHDESSKQQQPNQDTTPTTPKPQTQKPSSTNHSSNSYNYSYYNDEEEAEDCYASHFDFFHNFWAGYDYNSYDNEYDHFTKWHKTKQEAARQRREDIKNNYDWRDEMAQDSDEICMFCGCHKAITKESALASGLNWTEYSAHPSHYTTCWACLKSHHSVLTEAMAKKKFAGSLNVLVEGSYGPYNHVFWSLRKDSKAFHYRPVCGDRLTKNSCYYWYPDLKDMALQHGWKPRGVQSSQVPWRRKTESSTKTPPSTKRKAANVTREETKKSRPQHKGGLSPKNLFS